MNQYYVGSTQDITNRFEQHLTGRGKFTSRARDWELVFSKQFETRAEAVNLEMKIKKRGAKRFLAEMAG